MSAGRPSIYKATLPTYTDGQQTQPQVDSRGRAIVTFAGQGADQWAGEYETVAASQTAQVLGATGATGDYLAGVLIIPATVAAGLVTVLDNATSIPIYVGGATTPLLEVNPFYVPINAYSASGAWKITTGANVSVIATGAFT